MATQEKQKTQPKFEPMPPPKTVLSNGQQVTQLIQRVMRSGLVIQVKPRK